MRFVPTEPFDINASARTITRNANGGRVCNLPDCDEPHRRNGLCDRHAKRWDRWGDPYRVHPKYVRRAERRSRAKPRRRRRSIGRQERLAWLNLDQLGQAPVEGWERRAACGDQPPDVFFPDGGTFADYEPAVSICSGCPVRLDCLAANLTEKWGCYGGTMPGDRRYLIRQVTQRGAA